MEGRALFFIVFICLLSTTIQCADSKGTTKDSCVQINATYKYQWGLNRTVTIGLIKNGIKNLDRGLEDPCLDTVIACLKKQVSSPAAFILTPEECCKNCSDKI
uniref:Salivary secreted peptide n=1 Tax=Bursaphelenchus xylophilus TaxID=6326 RepID=A0A1I7SX42_BURXY